MSKVEQKGGDLTDIVEHTFDLPGEFQLACGERLTQPTLAYECYGTLSAKKDNAVLVCHALSSHHHAAGYRKAKKTGKDEPGWWNNLIGPGKAIDTNRFFVVCSNNLGGCHGSTGPTSTPKGGSQPYGDKFPAVEVEDWVRSQALLADHLHIKRWHAVVGGSLGGMQALEWSLLFPQRLDRAVVIAAAASLSAQNIAFNFLARQAITMSQKKGKLDGMGLARMVGHVTYLSELGMTTRFGRESPKEESGSSFAFAVEKYLEDQATLFRQSGFDANTYELMTRALDHFDPARRTDGNLTEALRPAQCRFLLVSFDSDWRFSPARSQEMVQALLQAGKSVSYLTIGSDSDKEKSPDKDAEKNRGHDSFLFPMQRYVNALSAFLALPSVSAQ